MTREDSASSQRAEETSVVDVVDAIKYASTIPAKQRRGKISGPVNGFCDSAFANGLDPGVVKDIIGIVSRKTELDQTSVTSIIKNLYPNAAIAEDDVIKIIGGLGQGSSKPSLTTQALLLRWLVLVYPVIQNQSVLSRLYGVLFGLLDMISLRTDLCRLLILITRRRHVRPFRIQKLLELHRAAGNEPALLALLRSYKDYYPDIVVGNTGTGRSSFLLRPDPEWEERVRRVKENISRQGHHNDKQESGFRVFRRHQHTKSFIPEVHTSFSTEASVTLEEIDGVDDFVAKLERIELPNQTIALLRDPLLRNYLMLSDRAVAIERAELWLASFLSEETEQIESGVGPSPTLEHILKYALAHAQHTKTLLRPVEAFLKRYLELWDNKLDIALILNLLVFSTINSFQDGYRMYFQRIESFMTTRDPNAVRKLLQFYTNLAIHWITRRDTPSRTLDSAEESLLQLAKHVDTLALSLFCSGQMDSTAANLVLLLYESISSRTNDNTNKENHSRRIVYPSIHVVYLFLFDTSLSNASRMCGILASCKQSFEALKNNVMKIYDPEYTNRFNGHLMDVCNLIWRSRALNYTDPNAMGCLSPEPLTFALQSYLGNIDRDYSLSTAFGLSHHHLISAKSRAIFNSLEESAEASGEELQVKHAGPVTTRSLVVLDRERGLKLSWKQYRVEILKGMDECGVGGIRELMYSTMTNLKELAT